MKIIKNKSRLFLFTFIVLFLIQCNSPRSNQNMQATNTEEYQCMPCGYDCDNKIYHEAGECPQCHMQLVKRSTVHFKTVQPTEICRYINEHPGVVLLDVRTKEEFNGKEDPDYGTLQNAVNVPVQELESRLSTLDSLKKREVVVYCSHSHRSPQACYILTQNGFTNVTNMAGGMSVMSDAACKK